MSFIPCHEHMKFSPETRLQSISIQMLRVSKKKKRIEEREREKKVSNQVKHPIIIDNKQLGYESFCVYLFILHDV